MAHTTARTKKELLRAILEEVIVAVQKQEERAQLTLRWRGGTITVIALDLPRRRQAAVRTEEDTTDLLRRPTPSSPAFSTGRDGTRPMATASPPAAFRAYASTGKYPAISGRL
jgi:hypothetical protein